jgi:2-iminobutanoate/2-iminopropanoate deaminase
MANVTVYRTPSSSDRLSPLTRIGDTLYTAGQVGVDPVSNEVVPGGVAAQTKQVLTNLRDALALAGADLSHVVKVTTFLTNADDFAAYNAAYVPFFPSNPPARSTVVVSALAHPDMVVEIEAIAVAPD